MFSVLIQCQSLNIHMLPVFDSITASILPIIIGIVVAVVAVIVVLFIIYRIHYKNTRIGRYILAPSRLKPSSSNGTTAHNGEHAMTNAWQLGQTFDQAVLAAPLLSETHLSSLENYDTWKPECHSTSRDTQNSLKTVFFSYLHITPALEIYFIPSNFTHSSHFRSHIWECSSLHRPWLELYSRGLRNNPSTWKPEVPTRPGSGLRSIHKKSLWGLVGTSEVCLGARRVSRERTGCIVLQRSQWLAATAVSHRHLLLPSNMRLWAACVTDITWF